MINQPRATMGKRARQCAFCALASAAELSVSEGPAGSGPARWAMGSPRGSAPAPAAPFKNQPSATPAPFVSAAPLASRSSGLFQARPAVSTAAEMGWQAPPGAGGSAKGALDRGALRFEQPAVGASLNKWIGDERPVLNEAGETALRLRVHRSSVKLMFSGAFK